MKPFVDYSLYLVTDSTAAILGHRDLVDVVEQALLGGVTIVQYRDKISSTSTLISTGTRLHKVCQKHNVPLLINDRIDVALAINCEGVHLGQDDTSISTARQILGSNKIIGATVSSVAEARVAVGQGADYLGIGTLYATATKKDTKDVIGIKGIRQILHSLNTAGGQAVNIKTVCIGGVNASNVQLITHQLFAPTPYSSFPVLAKSIDGVAVVSAIVGAADPEAAARNLKSLFNTAAPFAKQPTRFVQDLTTLQSSTRSLLSSLHRLTPLSHNMTNTVVQNFAANIALAVGASPIMSLNGAEAADLAALSGGLVVNMGTATPDALSNYAQAIRAYNAVGGPVVLDPVGAGATAARKEALRSLLRAGYFDLIKGNEREILAVAAASGVHIRPSSSSSNPKAEEKQRGVDSGAALFSLAQRAELVRGIALRERNMVLLTGATDLLSDGVHTLAFSNGHKYLGLVTGSGCSLGTVLAAYLAVAVAEERKNPEGGCKKLMAAGAGLLHYEIAAERAAAREDVKGPGTFVPAFVDELWKTRMEVVEGTESGVDWLAGAEVEAYDEPDTGFLSLEE